jgi:hypothetical protein
MKYSYSIDEEHYQGQYDSVGSAKEAGFNENYDYDSVWVGENRSLVAHDFVSTHHVLDFIIGNASDECGECAEGWLEKIYNDKDKCAELKALIGDWIEANDPVKFWTVDNVVRINKND